MKKLMIGGSILVAALLAPIAIMYYSQEEQLFRSRITPKDEVLQSPYPFQEIFLERDEALLHALHFKVANAKGVVLYFHGRGQNLALSWHEVAEDFVKRGYDIFIMDYRGFGKSIGKRSEPNLLDDALYCYDYLLSEYAESDVIVYGRSLGTGFATFAAAHRNPKMLVLESPYYSMLDLAPTTVPYFPSYLVELLLEYPLRTDLWIQNVKCPIHIFHSVDDELIPYHSSTRLFNLVSPNNQATLISIQKQVHHEVCKATDYQEALNALLNYTSHL